MLYPNAVVRRAVAALFVCASCHRPSAPTLDARPLGRPLRDASVAHDAHTQSTDAITSSEALPGDDRPSITACGALVSRGIGPRGSRSTLYHWGLRFVGEWEPALWLGPHPPWPGAGEGVARADLQPRDGESPRVCATGRFYRQFPLAPGDPPHASRFSGKWLFATSITRETTIRSARPTLTPQGWQTRWEIEANFVAQLGDRVLARVDRTSDDVVFALYDSRTGEEVRAIPWLSNALPYGQRTYSHRFTFAPPFVSVLQGEPATRTAVFELETGVERWSVRAPDTLRLASLAGGPVVAYVATRDARGRAVLRCANAASGTARWTAASRERSLSVVSTSPTAVLSFESPSTASDREGMLFWRDALTGRVRWSTAFRERSYEPILVAWSGALAWIAQGQRVIVASESGVRQQWDAGQRVTDLRVADTTAVVRTFDHRVVAFAEGSPRPRWEHAIDARCVHGGGQTVFAVIADAVWRELEPNTGETLYERGGGQCHWQSDVMPVEGEPHSTLVTRPSKIERRDRTNALVERRPLHITGQVTLDGRALPGVTVRLGALEARTDERGRFAFELRTEGEFSIAVGESLDRWAPGRCVQQRSNPDRVVHEREGGTREIALRFETFEPNPMTRCAQM